MENEHTQSFIPDTPLSSYEDQVRDVVELSTAGAVILLALAVAFIIATYISSFLLNRSIINYKTDLAEVATQIDQTTLGDLQGNNERLLALQDLISNHTYSSLIFNFLEENLVSSLRVNSFDLNYDVSSVAVVMYGVVQDINSIAYQVDTIEKSDLVDRATMTAADRDDTGAYNVQLKVVFKKSALRKLVNTLSA